jgi:hypothetical protein
VKIITNNVPRDLIDELDLTLAEREDFDYLDWDAIEEGTDSASFVRYRGQVMDLGNFTRGGPEGWDGSYADTFFSAYLIKIVDDERVIMGYYYA